MKENIATPIQELIERAVDYGKTTMELLKLKAIDKSINVISLLVAKTILIMVVAMFLLAGSTALALWLGELLGKAYYGFLIVAGFFGLISLLILAFGKRLIRYPVRDSITRNLFQ